MTVMERGAAVRPHPVSSVSVAEHFFFFSCIQIENISHVSDNVNIISFHCYLAVILSFFFFISVENCALSTLTAKSSAMVAWIKTCNHTPHENTFLLCIWVMQSPHVWWNWLRPQHMLLSSNKEALHVRLRLNHFVCQETTASFLFQAGLMIHIL